MNMQDFFARNAESLELISCGREYEARYCAAADTFRKLFSSEPTAFISAPGRIEVCGNHTDHQNGCVLAASVDLDALCVAEANNSMCLKLYSEHYAEPFVLDLNDLSVHEDEKNTTFSLIRGVAAGMVNHGYKIGGLNAYVTSRVDSGSGMSSSAAFEVMMVKLFDVLFNENNIDPKLNAAISQYAENAYFGKPSGIMDQSASAIGGLVSFDFANGKVETSSLNYDFREKNYSVCVVRAGGEHGSLTHCYASIPLEMREVAHVLGEENLQNVTPEMLMEALPKLKNKVPDRAILRAFHYVDETRRAPAAARALREDDLQQFFNVLIESGNSSNTLLQNIRVDGSENQELPLAYELSRRILQGRGAWRINGGGFAGTIIAFVPNDLLEQYTAVMDGVFGKGATSAINIRPLGAVAMK